VQFLKEKQDEEEKMLAAQEYSIRRSISKKELTEKFTFEKLNSMLEAKEKKFSGKPIKEADANFSILYGIEGLEKMGVNDFLDQYDKNFSTDTNLDNLLNEPQNLKEISNLNQRFKNPKSQAFKIEYF